MVYMGTVWLPSFVNLSILHVFFNYYYYFINIFVASIPLCIVMWMRLKMGVGGSRMKNKRGMLAKGRERFKWLWIKMPCICCVSTVHRISICTSFCGGALGSFLFIFLSIPLCLHCH